MSNTQAKNIDKEQHRIANSTRTENINNELERVANLHEQKTFDYFNEREYEQSVDDLSQNTVFIRERISPMKIEGKKFLSDRQLEIILYVLPYLQSGNISEALNYLTYKSKEKNLLCAERYQIFHLLGVIYQQSGKTRLAIDSYSNAISNVKNNEAHQMYAYKTYVCLGDISFRNLGEFDQALEYIEKALKCNPNVASPYILKLNILLKQENALAFEDTLANCKKIITTLENTERQEFIDTLLERFENDPFLSDWTTFHNSLQCKEILTELQQWHVNGKSEVA